MKIRSIAAVVATGLLMAGCGTVANERTSPAAGLAGVEWQVQEIGGQGVIADSEATLLFGTDGRLSGNTSCNRLLASYEVEGSRLQIRQAGSTMMACPPPAMEQERRMLALLDTVQGYRIDAGVLTLSTQAGGTIVARHVGAAAGDR